ncbi:MULTISPECIES: hypothetical protein [unclassified Pseudomonas]|uniref:hypothetical protein n=1 Tax=unclassified Pseudomonas TaxID=196821 RepID=UPI002ACB0E7C|nr:MULTISPECIES: hypothetical protein [unclassified Pseudomonas]MEB0041601.1 hypothetical protein [Pseudomonas sp. MH10]MEB0092345.1 hypothetical protein [Pseudomonas sp. CCI4.2]MEB0123255.1 hypothetical protein [Pseudomonas sp. CCI1.2]WPX55315.1 hypothetical protein RHM65_07045 [Pseudomonas sp. CCI4.2]WPX62752.1 hypothetical protein RHM59_17725 [Pseudomonas sp. MH10]
MAKPHSIKTVIEKHGFLIVTSIAISITSAALQIAIPYVISNGIREITASQKNVYTIFVLIFIFSGKSILQCACTILNHLIEARIRLSLIEHIYAQAKSNKEGELITLIKEDSERVAASVIQILELTASGCLTLVTFIVLTFDNYFMAAPLMILFGLSYLHVTRFTKCVGQAYTLEIDQEQKYKASIIRLKKASFNNAHRFNFRAKSTEYNLRRSINTRYLYERLCILLSGTPEIIVSAMIAASLFLIATLSPGMLGAEMLYYLGYVGMFALGANSSIQAALSIVGTKVSINRIFKRRI